jgi:hypothetical protein
VPEHRLDISSVPVCDPGVGNPSPLMAHPEAGSQMLCFVQDGWKTACPLPSGKRGKPPLRRGYFSGRNISAIASCSGTSGKNARRWQ